MSHLALSVIVPVYNEEMVLQELFSRLYAALDAMGRPYEVLFVDDGSADASVALLRVQYQRRPDTTRVLVLAGNFGQHNAILAGFAHARGNALITLDADLQNPPEEIPRLLAELERGHDYVGTIRVARQDTWFRSMASRLLNGLREKTTRIRMTDQGCMLRAYSRSVVDAVNACTEVNTFVPALAYLCARSPTEIEVSHAERAAGTSKYSLYRLIRLNFDLMTGFSIAPLQLYSVLGTLISALSLAFVPYLGIRRLVVGPEAAGVFTLLGIAFFLIGIVLLGVGLLGEYVGRIYAQVQNRPRYRIAAALESVAPSHPSNAFGNQEDHAA
ncbi:MAG TPA: glycosyltransferase [Steroidobacteraceae bacterium]|jgi:undecaprenyl-phosphate 4-deoxy-4-formamido-L-arabinose transferase